MAFDNVETVKRTVEIGDALSILPETTLVNERRAGSLVSIEITGADIWRPVGVITRRSRVCPPALLKFLDLLRAGQTPGKLAKS
jgi:DNA-binding transcriptional LysR family regulator